MTEQLVSFETAKLAKEKGFDIECERYFNENGEMWTYHNWGVGLYDEAYWRPTQSLLQKWLREKHNIRVYPKQGVSGNFNFEIYIWDNPNNVGKWTRIGNISSLDTYEEALEQGLFEALKLIK